MFIKPIEKVDITGRPENCNKRAKNRANRDIHIYKCLKSSSKTGKLVQAIPDK